MNHIVLDYSLKISGLKGKKRNIGVKKDVSMSLRRISRTRMNVYRRRVLYTSIIKLRVINVIGHNIKTVSACYTKGQV